jgi:aspartyl-tRNA(Asn)/glutamyl-tRNA(Gln) amidotransferase subunit A
MTLLGKNTSEIHKLLKNKEASAVELTQAHLAYIEKSDHLTKAFLCLTKDLALKQAGHIDSLIASGKPLPPLAGVPLAVKDVLAVNSYPTTCGSKILENFSPIYDATAVQLLFEAGAICVGKTNCDEFAMGSSNENSAYAKVANPWNLDYVPGGSSGGSAAAVAAGFATIALGTDTGGSVRQPASLCGVVGMKPTYGLTSRFGLFALASSLDHVGPFARTVEDAVRTLAVIAKHDPNDSTSVPEKSRSKDNDMASLLNELPQITDLKGLKIGVIKELTGEGNEKGVEAAINKAIETLISLGATVNTVSIPKVKYALPVYYILNPAEASSNLARYDGVKYGMRDKKSEDLLSMYLSTRQIGFGPEPKRRIMLGTYVLSSGYYDAYYKKAQKVRRLLTEEFNSVFKSYDLVICPTSPTTAFKLGDRTDDPLKMYLADIASIPADLAGLPAVSIPCGFDNNLPIGLQFMGAPLTDKKVLRAAYAFEKVTKFAKKQCPMLEQAVLAKI